MDTILCHNKELVNGFLIKLWCVKSFGGNPVTFPEGTGLQHVVTDRVHMPTDCHIVLKTQRDCSGMVIWTTYIMPTVGENLK